MIDKIINLFLKGSFFELIQAKYVLGPHRGHSGHAGRLKTFFLVMGCLFLRLESPAWMALAWNRRRLYPQLYSFLPRPLDALRYLSQSAWLIIVHPDRRRLAWLMQVGIGARLLKKRQERKFVSFLSSANKNVINRGIVSKENRFVVISSLILSFIIFVVCVVQPLNVQGQFIFSSFLLIFSFFLISIPGRTPALILMCISFFFSCRYMWWRYTSTLKWDDPISAVCGCLLLCAETYAWFILLLGYFQVAWPLHREPVSMPADEEMYPEVDVFIPTYNEPFNIVQSSINGALGMDWPKNKLTVWLLDDGGREELRKFSELAGIRYLARPTHEHAKAGNINYALKKATGKYVAIFDCDHIPSRVFLQMTMGLFFKDPKLALVQTPHHFFSPDPFEKHSRSLGEVPNEDRLFHGLIQDGNDTWNATFFCGSCAVIERNALDAIDGIAVETVTEDAHTSLKLHRMGYHSAYIRIPLAAGLATENLASYIGQRLRWARGMTQIFRLDNPFFGRGLSLAQRFCYSNAMLHFLFGIPRLIFFLAPLFFLIFHAYIIFSPAIMIVLFVVPYMLQSTLANSRIHGQFRHSFWNEIYEAVLAWYLAWPTLVTLFSPHKGKFNVTEKGSKTERSHVDWVLGRPYFFIIFLNVLGILFAIWRFFFGDLDERGTVIISLFWVFYNLLILGGAIAVLSESKQIRQWQRVSMMLECTIVRNSGHLLPCKITDYSYDSLGMEIEDGHGLKMGEVAQVILNRGSTEHQFPAKMIRVSGTSVGVLLDFSLYKNRIEFMRYTFGRADVWSSWHQSASDESLLRSLINVMSMGGRGYLYLGQFFPWPIRRFFEVIAGAGKWVWSFAPRNPVL